MFSHFERRTIIHGARVSPIRIELYSRRYYFVFPLLLIGAAAESLLIYYERRALKRRVHYVRFLAIEHHK